MRPGPLTAAGPIREGVLYRGRVDLDARRGVLEGTALGPTHRARYRAYLELRPDWRQVRVPARLHRRALHLRPLLLAARTQPAVATCSRCTRTTTSCSTTAVLDPDEQTNLAYDPLMRALVDTYRDRLESLIDAEIGPDAHAWAPERLRLLGWPSWRGDAA